MQDFVELVVVGAVEAVVIAGRLRSEGIEAEVFEAPSSPYPALGWSQGSSVLVREGDREAALALLGDEEAETEKER